MFSVKSVTSAPVSMSAQTFTLSNKIRHDVGSFGVLRLTAFPK